MSVAAKFFLVLTGFLLLFLVLSAIITVDGSFLRTLETFLWTLVVALPAAAIFLSWQARWSGLIAAVICMYVISGIWMALVPFPEPLSGGNFARVYLTRPLVPLIAFLLTIAITRPRRHLATE